MDEQRNGGPGLFLRGLTYLLATLSVVWQKATQDGTLAAAGRQGLDEVGIALKAFPDAIQTQEPGTVFNPTQGEIAADRRQSLFGHDHVSPSSIVGSHSGVHGPERAQPNEASPVRSPSQIVADHRGSQGAEQAHDAGHDTAWRRRIDQERAGNQDGNGGGQSEQGQERSLPEEQRERDQGRGR